MAGKRWLRGRDEGRGLEKEDPPIPALTHLIQLSLTHSLNGGASQGLTSSMGHLVSRGLYYLGHIWVLRAPPLNPGVPSSFGRSLTVTEGTRRHPSSSFSSPWCVGYPCVLSFLSVPLLHRSGLSLCGRILRSLVTAEPRSSVLSVAGLQLVDYIPDNQTQRKHCLNTWVGSGLGHVLESAHSGSHPALSAGDRQAQGIGSAHYLRLDPFVH